MAEEEKKKSFWETLPGIITAIAALITAIAALVAAMNGGSKEGAAKSEAPAAAAAPPQSSVPPANDEAARRAAELERKLSEIAAAKAKAEAEAAAAKARAEEAERRAAELERKKAELPPVVNADQQKGRTIGQYIDHGDGTITDEKSGLMWKRCPEGLSGVNCEKGETKTYKWNDAVNRFENIEYAGYKDWRMPSIDELKTLVQCSKGKNKDGDCNHGSEKPTINQQAFPNTEATWYWSGSPFVGNPYFAWSVDFNLGNSDYVLVSRDYDYAVRLVRGGQ